MFSKQNLTASPHIMSTDPLAIPVKKGEKFLRFMQLLRGSTFEGEQSKVVKNSVYLVYFVYVYGYSIMFWIIVVIMGLIHCGYG